jgi:hypothetical protein
MVVVPKQPLHLRCWKHYCLAPSEETVIHALHLEAACFDTTKIPALRLDTRSCYSTGVVLSSLGRHGNVRHALDSGTIGTVRFFSQHAMDPLVRNPRYLLPAVTCAYAPAGGSHSPSSQFPQRTMDDPAQAARMSVPTPDG